MKPEVTEGYNHVWHQYTIRVEKDRDKANNELNKAGVGTGIFYPVPAHRQTHLAKMGLDGASVPVVEMLAQQVISIPVHPQLSQDDLEKIVLEVNKL